MSPLGGSHHPKIQFSDLVVLASLAFVGPMTPSADDVRGGLVRRFSDRLSDKGGSGRGRVGRLVAVWELLLSVGNSDL
jgi:hypothetical protein